MKAMRLLLFVLSLVTLPVIIESCCMSGASCCNMPDPEKFTVNNIKLEVMTFSGSGYVTAPQSIKPKSMSFNFDLDITNLAMQERKTIRPTMAAYACDPLPNSSKEKITEFTITSDKPLIISDQVTIAAGDDLTPGFSLAQSMAGDYFYLPSFNMVPNFTLQTSQDHEFTFRFTLDDGRVFELRSGTYTLLP
jgi:hypothetical protein